MVSPFLICLGSPYAIGGAIGEDDLVNHSEFIGNICEYDQSKDDNFPRYCECLQVLGELLRITSYAIGGDDPDAGDCAMMTNLLKPFATFVVGLLQSWCGSLC